MKYAVIRTGGKQYKISEGDTIAIERIVATHENKITFSEVLMVADGEDVNLGAPLLTGFSVLGTVIEDFRGEKIRVAKFKAKARYRRVTGHRQELTRVKIDAINGGNSKAKAAAEPKAVVKPVKEDKKVTTSVAKK